MPESATECADSASSDAEPVMANAVNLVAAMPRLAARAAMTARLPPLCSDVRARPTDRRLSALAVPDPRSLPVSRASSISSTGMSSRTG